MDLHQYYINMNKKKLNRKLVALLLMALVWGCCGVTTSCDTMRTYWGVEGTYGDGYYDGDHHHRPPKPPKHKKHKKHKKDKHHHHHDHDDD